MTFLKLKYYFIKFKVYIYICGAVLVLLVFAVLLRKVNPFTRADSQTLLGIIGTLLGAVVGAVFTLLGSIWVNTQQKKEEWNRKAVNSVYENGKIKILLRDLAQTPDFGHKGGTL